ncbi:MAG: hypothetical protein LBV16_06110, partial [Elusimicrobiota bacterium]|nr:hypothetical protein [Elusimicrobiota bacterium]
MNNSTFVWADPSVCPHQINFPSPHISPTPSLPSVSIDRQCNPLSPQSASLHLVLSLFNSFCRLLFSSRFSLPLLSLFKRNFSFKPLLLALPLIFLFCVESNAQRYVPTASNSSYVTALATYSGYNVTGVGGAWSITGGITINVTGIAGGAATLLFENNTAYQTGSSGEAFGGAIHVNNSNLTINLPNNTVSFINNHVYGGASNHGGGAISARNGASVTITSKRLIIDGNKMDAGGDQNTSGGGGFRLDSSNIIVHSSTVIFTRNSSAQDGPGGMFGGNSVLTFSASVSSVEFSNGFGAFNSVMYLYNSNNQINFLGKKSYFIRNIADNGADWWGVLGITGGSGHQIIFDNSAGETYFIENYASGHGSVISVNGSNNSVRFNNQKITAIGNTANTNGGVIGMPASGSSIEFINSVSSFSNNKSPTGAIISLTGSGSKITFDGGQMIFTANTSWDANSQGVISLAAGSMEIKNIQSMIGRGNKAGYGGFLYLPNLTFNFTGSVVELTSNTAFNATNGYGGGLYFTNSIASFRGDVSSFSWNTAWGTHGGAMYIVSNSSATFGAGVSV